MGVSVFFGVCNKFLSCAIDFDDILCNNKINIFYIGEFYGK